MMITFLVHLQPIQGPGPLKKRLDPSTKPVHIPQRIRQPTSRGRVGMSHEIATLFAGNDGVNNDQSTLGTSVDDWLLEELG